MRFLVDMPLSPELAVWVNSLGHTATHVSRLGLVRATDAEIILRAAFEEAIIVTADLDYRRLLALASASGPSVIPFRGGQWSEADIRDRFIEVFAELGRDPSAAVITINGRVIRRRSLPID